MLAFLHPAAIVLLPGAQVPPPLLLALLQGRLLVARPWAARVHAIAAAAAAA